MTKHDQQPTAARESDRIYRLLLNAYSPAFRSRFGRQAAIVFQDCLLDAKRRGGPSLVLFWLNTGLDLVVTAVPDRIAQIGSNPMNRRIAVPFATLAMIPACLFWGVAIALWLGVKLGLGTVYLGTFLGGVLPSIDPRSAEFSEAAFVAFNAIIFAGPIVALCALSASMLQIAVTVEDGRVRMNVATRWLGPLDLALIAILLAVGACSALWLIPHAFFGT